MISRLRQANVAPSDLARFLVAFGLVPLLLAREFERDVPPWTFALTPSWSGDQLAMAALLSVVLGAAWGRSARGVAWITLGILLGLSADLWWLAGRVTSYDQAFVSMLPPAEWRARMTESILALLGVSSASFALGAVARWLIRNRSVPWPRRPTRPEIVAVGVTAIGGPLMALVIAFVAASSALLVPDGAQVQTVRVSATEITVDPAVLRSGPVRFRCEFSLDAMPAWGYLVALPDGVDVETAPPAFDDYYSSCGLEPGSVSWGTIADPDPGRYVWRQIDYQIDYRTDPRTITTSPVVLVAP